jgi:hypothetical protein
VLVWSVKYWPEVDELRNAGTSRWNIRSRWLVDEVETNSDRETKDCSDSAIVEMARSEGSCGAENQINY